MVGFYLDMVLNIGKFYLYISKEGVGFSSSMGFYSIYSMVNGFRVGECIGISVGVEAILSKGKST